ncbi:GntR family transcriptional regulator [Saccharothrix violaceirubra]|uniref:GntR family transcriptional regulator n=1 Tax=Saccharothrix violaceirubra TaxID=413306 RepID=A0A7W7T8I2_9PSEU|nr:GntR family transcriptional regulator [Saccharothrix violaceirubra]MBB4967245.1 GntR family transcriptional regulator [Saccharothrix violaceirubra]
MTNATAAPVTAHRAGRVPRQRGGGVDEVKYRLIADHLIAAMNRGEHPVGSTLPTLQQLMERFGVARGTARAAVAVLVAEGLATPRQGYGTVVSATRTRSDQAKPRTLPSGIPHPKVVLSGWTAATPDIASRLGIPAGTLVVHRIRHHHTGTRVTRIEQQWLPESIATAIEERTGHDISDRDDTPQPDLTPLLRHAGFDPVVATVQVGARLPDHAEADTMRLSTDTPLVVVDRITHSSSGSPVEVTSTVSTTGRTAPRFTIPITG